MKYRIILFCFILLVAGCLPVPQGIDPDVDLTPPALEKVVVSDNRSVTLYFDEGVMLAEEEIITEPSLSVASTSSTDNTVTVQFHNELQPGKEYIIRAEARDRKENSMFLITRFYGYNGSIPGLMINEFTTRGSETHPDCVEIKILQEGNLAGICFFHGTKTLFKYRFVFPACEVKPGDYILLHTKPVGTPDEINETNDKTVSEGLDASSTAFDFWIPKGSGLSGNNGTITLYNQPFGTILDAVLYTNRTSASDTDYMGFGSRTVMEQAIELEQDGGWKITGLSVAPEDAVFIEESTATRSVCRMSAGVDTDSKADWHIVPTKGYTFGTQNSDENHVP
ncbi:MAG: Ig-like domain-containing protein [Spirochaetales bacterium]|nr:Ig-like domain-containing protein [Spirochaetales bacterium]